MKPTFAEKKTRARTLLKRLLTSLQWGDLERYDSFREQFSDRAGLPLRRVEFGRGFQGWIEFRQNSWDIPEFLRVTETTTGYWDEWVIEDSIITNLLKVRLNPVLVLDPGWGCTTRFNNSDDVFKDIIARTFHTKRLIS